jgi:SAM-dependent methyltransferase
MSRRYMSSSDHRLSGIASVRPARHRSGSMAFHPYFGKLDPALARAIIEQYSRPGDIVLDPFCGSGTVLQAALLTERSAVGWDSSPLAVLIATGRLLGLDVNEELHLRTVGEGVQRFGSRAPMFQQPIPGGATVPPMPRVNGVESWFKPNALRELAFLRAHIASKEALLPRAVFLLAITAFSRIIVQASNQQGESSYRRITKPDTPGRVIDLFVDALSEVAGGALAFTEAIRSIAGGAKRSLVQSDAQAAVITWGQLRAEILQHDTRLALDPSFGRPFADVVVSSPPYLMSWDYGLYHKFRFYWLGFDLDSYEITEIGRHLRRKRDDVNRYRDDMARAFRSMEGVVREGGHIVLVNAPSVVYGKTVDTNALLAECAREAGWELADRLLSLSIPGPHHGMYASLPTRGAVAPGGSGKREHVLVFRRA